MIDELRQCRSGERADVWRILMSARSADEFAVGLDYAIEYGLWEAEFAGQLRGEEGEFPRRAWRHPTTGLEMAWIPGGPFIAADPPRELACDGFFLARHPVTNEQFEQFVVEAGYLPEIPETFLRHWSSGASGARLPPLGMGQHPVTWVSYVDALAYCAWGGLALPSEWHWEKAARGTDGRIFPWGDAAPLDRYRSIRLANVESEGTCRVGSFPRVRTPYGCEDLIGNVSEWCVLVEPAASETAGRRIEPPDTQTDWTRTTLAAVRGSAYLRKANSRMRAVHRRRLSVFRRNQWVGFRPAFFPLRRIKTIPE